VATTDPDVPDTAEDLTLDADDLDADGFEDIDDIDDVEDVEDVDLEDDAAAVDDVGDEDAFDDGDPAGGDELADGDGFDDGGEVALTDAAMLATFDPEDAEAIVALVEDDEDDEEGDGVREGEFVCRSCFMAMRMSALADPDAMLCRDCA
jgi:hypothetical protein